MTGVTKQGGRAAMLNFCSSTCSTSGAPLLPLSLLLPLLLSLVPPFLAGVVAAFDATSSFSGSLVSGLSTSVRVPPLSRLVILVLLTTSETALGEELADDVAAGATDGISDSPA